MSLKIETITNGAFQENAFVVFDDEAKKAIIVDPGDEPERIARTPQFHGLEVTEIVCTHAHIDHAGAANQVKKLTGAPFAMHRDEAPVLDSLASQARLFGLAKVETPEVDRWLDEGDEIEVGGYRARVIHTPGHTPGGCCLFFESERVLIAGDTLFQGSIGRTDLPGGSFKQIIDSIKGKIFPLGDDVTVYCGHGPRTNVGLEKQINPFVR